MIELEKVIKECACAIDILAKAEESTIWIDFVRFAIENALALLKKQKAIVRCKDCDEYYFASNRAPHEQSWACGKHGIDVTPDWFCADGERRGSGNEKAHVP